MGVSHQGSRRWEGEGRVMPPGSLGSGYNVGPEWQTCGFEPRLLAGFMTSDSECCDCGSHLSTRDMRGVNMRVNYSLSVNQRLTHPETHSLRTLPAQLVQHQDSVCPLAIHSPSTAPCSLQHVLGDY